MAFEDRKFSLDKQPAEKLTIGVDFANDLGAGEIIAGAAVGAVDLSDGSAAGGIVLDGSYSISGSTVSQTVKAGDDGKRYKITIRAITDAPHVFEADIIMTVHEL
jgi:hypothetical protein